jgi:outer membrane protein TolC
MTVRPIFLAFAGAAALLILSGCALNEQIGRPNTDLPAQFEAPQASSTASVASLDQWWVAFNDPQLTSLVSQALVSAPDARSAFFRLAEARATRNQDIAGVFPKGDIAASAQDEYSRQSYSKLSAGIPPAFAAFFTAANGSTQQYAASWNTSWELDLYGKDFTAIKAAKAGFAAARFDFEATRLSVAAEVATDLFQARGIAAQLQDAGETERLARSLADTTRRKAEAGLATTADAARTLSDQQSAAAQTALLEAQLRSAVRSLLVLIGRGGALAATLPVSADISPPPDLPAVTPGLLLTRRPDIREAEENLTAGPEASRVDLHHRHAVLDRRHRPLGPGAQFTAADRSGAN